MHRFLHEIYLERGKGEDLEAIKDSTIKEQLVSILHDRYHVSLSPLGTEQWDIPLTSREIGLSGFELAHLFFEIEKIYGKSFEESILKDYGFCTINNIARAILLSNSDSVPIESLDASIRSFR